MTGVTLALHARRLHSKLMISHFFSCSKVFNLGPNH
ncbi:hypothetical protein Golax_025193, partial [Gossypium laxum]|nr:hypothetical protein [Gossypium laxum]